MLKKLSYLLVLSVAIVAMIFTGGCANNAQTGAAIGCIGGVTIGAIAGGGGGAVVGGLVGAGGGYVIGNEMDK